MDNYVFLGVGILTQVDKASGFGTSFSPRTWISADADTRIYFSLGSWIQFLRVL